MLKQTFFGSLQECVCVCIQSTVHPTSCLDSRLLETDSKSLRSMNGSRRNSGSSLVSSSSASSNLSHLEEDSWILWGRIVNEWEEVRKKKEKQLKVRPVHTTTCDMSVRSLMKNERILHNFKRPPCDMCLYQALALKLQRPCFSVYSLKM